VPRRGSGAVGLAWGGGGRRSSTLLTIEADSSDESLPTYLHADNGASETAGRTYDTQPHQLPASSATTNHVAVQHNNENRRTLPVKPHIRFPHIRLVSRGWDGRAASSTAPCGVIVAGPTRLSGRLRGRGVGSCRAVSSGAGRGRVSFVKSFGPSDRQRRGFHVPPTPGRDRRWRSRHRVTLRKSYRPAGSFFGCQP